jgi:hypothetical protein
MTQTKSPCCYSFFSRKWPVVIQSSGFQWFFLGCQSPSRPEGSSALYNRIVTLLGMPPSAWPPKDVRRWRTRRQDPEDSKGLRPDYRRTSKDEGDTQKTAKAFDLTTEGRLKTKATPGGQRRSSVNWAKTWGRQQGRLGRGPSHQRGEDTKMMGSSSWSPKMPPEGAMDPA